VRTKLKKRSTTLGYQAGRAEPSHVCWTCMTCNIGHPSTADRAWYWPKHVLCIE